MSPTSVNYAAYIQAARYNSQQTYPARDWVVNDLFAMGMMNVWIGPEKSRKSSFALLLAMHLAAGKDFFGFVIPRPRTVVFFSAEDPSEELDLRYKGMLRQFSPQEQALIQQNLAVIKGREQFVNKGLYIGADGKEFWDEFVQQYPGAMYILDALQMFHSGNSNDEMRGTMLKLRHHCGPQNCLLILHHTRKREDREIGARTPVLLRNVGARLWSDKALGAGAFKRLADTIICQEWVQQRDGDQVTDEWTDFAAFGKSIVDVPLLTFRDVNNYSYSLVRDLNPAVHESLEKLKNAGGPWPSKNAAAKVLGISRTQANLHVRELLRKGWLREAGQNVELV